MLKYDSNNIFNKIIHNEIPSVKVYENEDVIAIMDVMPQGRGHILVIPREPSRNLLDAKPTTLVKIMPSVQKIAQAVQKALNADGVTIMQFNEEAGGQTIFHLHFHIIPRFNNIMLKPHNNTIIDNNELEKDAIKIRKFLNIK